MNRVEKWKHVKAQLGWAVRELGHNFGQEDVVTDIASIHPSEMLLLPNSNIVSCNI